ADDGAVVVARRGAPGRAAAVIVGAGGDRRGDAAGVAVHLAALQDEAGAGARGRARLRTRARDRPGAGLGGRFDDAVAAGREAVGIKREIGAGVERATTVSRAEVCDGNVDTGGRAGAGADQPGVLARLGGARGRTGAGIGWRESDVAHLV